MPEASFGTEVSGVEALVASVPVAASARVAISMLPAAALVAALMAMTGVLVPVATVIGKVPVTALTIVAAPSSFALSAALIEPAAPEVAGVIEIAGADPPLETMGAVPVTPVTVPPPPPPPTPAQADPVQMTTPVVPETPVVSYQSVPVCTGAGAVVKDGKAKVMEPSVPRTMLVVGDPVFSIADTDSKLIASHDAISLVGFTLCRWGL
jgi:hypothetical protein